MDECGLSLTITAITGSTAATYTYDAQNQLLSETRGGKTYSYTYNSAGNILSKTKTSGSGTDSYIWDVLTISL